MAVGVMDGKGVALAVGVVVAVGVAVRVAVGVALGDGVAVGVGVGGTVTGGGPDELYSYAPMEQFVAPVPGRTKPRWSRLFTVLLARIVLVTFSRLRRRGALAL